jgi:hypothetical protein
MAWGRAKKTVEAQQPFVLASVREKWQGAWLFCPVDLIVREMKIKKLICFSG